MTRWEQCSFREIQCQKRKYSAIFAIITIFATKTHCFTSVVLTNVFSLWKYWQSEGNKLFCTWYKRMTQFCISLSCILLISNSMHGFSSNLKKHTLVSSSKTSNSTRPSDSCYFYSLWKTHSCVFFPNCTRNHTITYIYKLFVLSLCLYLDGPICGTCCTHLFLCTHEKKKIIQITLYFNKRNSVITAYPYLAKLLQ